MPVLTVHDPPPIANVDITIKPGSTVKNVPSVSTMDVAKSPTTELPEEGFTSKFPIAKMDMEVITNSIAARLASTLLGHVLFLKNQVPFPVLQLGKMPAGKSSARATKHRQEMLSSFDTICSHLDTTFSALSTAMAKCSPSQNEDTAQIYMAILVGPSLSTAKSKVLLGIDGLEKRVWGTRADTSPQSEKSDNEESDSDEDSGDEDSEGLEQPDDSEEEADEEDDEEEEDDDEEQEDGEEEGEEEEEGDGQTDIGVGDDDRSRVQVNSGDIDVAPKEVQVAKSSSVSICPPADYISPAEQEKLLKSADRLLSRTLASADAAGNGFFSEISPTQTHVLLRAPRRFNHPAWIPRQNVISSLDTSVSEFLEGSVPSSTGQMDTVNEKSANKHRNKNKTEGIWITTRHGIRPTPPQAMSPASSSQEELDDMIWWSWDGKFVGFADW